MMRKITFLASEPVYRMNTAHSLKDREAQRAAKIKETINLASVKGQMARNRALTVLMLSVATRRP